MLNAFFKWLRDGAANAIEEGIADGIERATNGNAVSPRLAALAAKFTPTPALPAAEVETDEPDTDKPARKPKGAK